MSRRGEVDKRHEEEELPDLCRLTPETEGAQRHDGSWSRVSPEREEEQNHEKEKMSTKKGLSRMDLEDAEEQWQSSIRVNPEGEEEQKHGSEMSRTDLEEAEEHRQEEAQHQKNSISDGRWEAGMGHDEEETASSNWMISENEEAQRHEGRLTRVSPDREEEQRNEREMPRWHREDAAEQRHEGDLIRSGLADDEEQRLRWTVGTQRKRRKKVRLCRSVYLREGAAGEGKKNQ
ncbi:hypothetical protein SLA2020_237750 [Shorea laevis]